MTELLDSITDPSDLRRLSTGQLEQLAREVRHLIIQVVSRNRGHLASNLGVVELTLALHKCFDFKHDRLVWDCGHQAYAHKIITGRREGFESLRQKDGVSGFADRRESPYDSFSFGHTGTSISSALGMACADHQLGVDRRVVAVIGDGAMASGMPFEALNHAGALGRDLLVVLNDNKMSISRSVGALAKYLSKIRSSAPYADVKQELQSLLNIVPLVGQKVDGLLARFGEGVQSFLTPGGVFVELGFHYYGPVDGHSLPELVGTLEDMKRIKGPVLLHVLTEKGHGFQPASDDPTRFHSSKRFEHENGTLQSVEESKGDSYSAVFGRALCKLAEEEPRIVAITAAMPDGTGLTKFADRFPDRFHDVGICEQHALGLANGMTAGGLRPVFAVYSTFLQRAYDQLFHDVALQDAPVVLCIDRAGLVGDDGPTHHGLNDVACCRVMPGVVVMAPKDGPELEHMLDLALKSDRPAAIRYPRELAPTADAAPAPDFQIGQAEVCAEGKDAAIIAYGSMVARAVEAADILQSDHGLSITVINARFASPLDLDTLVPAVTGHPAVLLAEEHNVAGGFGAAVLEALSERGAAAGQVRQAAVPREPVWHAPREDQLARCGLNGPGLARRVLALLGRESSD